MVHCLQYYSFYNRQSAKKVNNSDSVSLAPICTLPIRKLRNLLVVSYLQNIIN